MGRLIEADAIYKILESCEIKKDTYGSLLNDWDHGYNCGIERAESEIECAPTVEAEPVRHGHWNGIEKESRGYTDIFECSECKCYVRTPFMMKVMEYDFCPSCGAKMERKEK